MSSKHEEEKCAAYAAYEAQRRAFIEAGRKEPEPKLGIPWEDEAICAAWIAGWDVIAFRGSEGYEGWGKLLLARANEWAVLCWNYGTCGGCDMFIHRPADEVLADMAALVDVQPSEEKARTLFDEVPW